MTIIGFLLLLGTFVSMLGTAFFVATETALISSDKVYLDKRKKAGLRSATLALQHLENLDYLLSTTQFGANLFLAAATTLATLFLSKLNQGAGSPWFFVFAPLMLVFSDSLPKVIGRSFPERISLLASFPLWMFGRIFAPVLALLSIYTTRLSRLVGLGRQDTLSRRKKTREELHALLAENDSDSEIRLGHKRMIRRILEFSQQNVKKVMLPFVSVDAIEKESTVQEAIDMFETLRHSRLPVYEERIDNIVGILHFPDVFKCRDPDTEKVHRYMRPALFVPEIQQLETLTNEMTESEMAIVVDEYGGAVGVVTREDVLEEIVGDISDEWDEHNLGVTEISQDSYLVHVNLGVHEVNERLGIAVPKGEYETLAGFLLQQFNRIPSQGDELYFANFKVKVHRASEKAIETVIITVHRDKAELHEEEP
ncbi:MAG TPA: hemolysin family protein [Bdellovibrionota bacterium]|jgi:putative hemolysin